MKKRLLCSLLFCFCLFVSAQQNNSQLAMQYFREQEYEKASTLFAQLYQKNTSYYTYFFQSLLGSSQFKEAEKLVRKQIKAQAHVIKYQVDLGYVFDRQGEEAKAKKLYQSLIDQIGQGTNSVEDLASAFQGYQLNDFVIKTYLQGRKMANSPGRYALELAFAYQRNNLYNKAMEEILLVLNHEPNRMAQVQAFLLSWWQDDESGNHKEIIKTQLLKANSKDPDNKNYAEMLIWFATQEKDFSLALKQAKALVRRYREDGRRVFLLANIAAENKDYLNAIEAYDFVLNMAQYSPYYQAAKENKINAQFDQLDNSFPVDVVQLQKLDKELSAHFSQTALNASNIALYRRWLRVKSQLLKQTETVITMLQNDIEDKQINEKERALLKIDLGDLRCLQGDVWEATLLYSQVEKAYPNDTVAQLAKYKNAKLSFMIGEFEWAKAQLDVLRAATSKLIANDAMQLSLLIGDNQDENDSVDIALKQYALSLFLGENNALDQALQQLETIDCGIYSPLSDDVLLLEARLYRKKRQFEKADSLYQALIDNYQGDLLVDDAIFERAQMQEIDLNNRLLAMDLYQQLILDHSNSIYAVEARSRFRTLRGDLLQ